MRSRPLLVLGLTIAVLWPSLAAAGDLRWPGSRHTPRTYGHGGSHHDWHHGPHHDWHQGFHWAPDYGWHSGRHHGWHGGTHHDWHDRSHSFEHRPYSGYGDYGHHRDRGGVYFHWGR